MDPTLATCNRNKKFTENIETYRSTLIKFVCSRGYTLADAEDVVQKASIKIWDKYADYAEGSNFLSWAITITYNELRNDMRISKRRPLVQDHDLYVTVLTTTLAPTMEISADVEKLEGLLLLVPQERASLLRSVYIENENIDSLAKKAGKSPQTYYNLLNITKKKLAKDMKNE